MISVTDYSKKIKNQMVLDNINVEFENGKCYGIVGYNGCGKTMLLRAICGYIKPDKGEVMVDGMSMNNNYIHDAGIIIGDPEFINNYTGYENLEILAAIRNEITSDDIDSYLDKLDLLKDKNKKYKSYSLGMKQKLRIAQAFMENPKYLILDEPFNALDKKSVECVEQLIAEAKEEGKTIFLTSHDERNIEKLCDVVYEMENGRLEI